MVKILSIPLIMSSITMYHDLHRAISLSLFLGVLNRVGLERPSADVIDFGGLLAHELLRFGSLCPLSLVPILTLDLSLRPERTTLNLRLPIEDDSLPSATTARFTSPELSLDPTSLPSQATIRPLINIPAQAS